MIRQEENDKGWSFRVAWGLWTRQVSEESSSAGSGVTSSLVWRDLEWDRRTWLVMDFIFPSVLSHLIPFFETTYDSVRQCCFKKIAGKISFDRWRVIDHSSRFCCYLPQQQFSKIHIMPDELSSNHHYILGTLKKVILRL